MALTSPSHEFTYDVYLSFRGQDTRFGFTGYLYNALHESEIDTFFDDKKLLRGEEPISTLMKAIEESRIAIVVFSTNFASSSFCLDELAYILECHERKGLWVFPVFYKVDPLQVLRQIGSYGEALAEHEKRYKHNMVKLQGWRMALRKVAELSGFHFRDGYGYEYEFIKRIVESVSSKLNRIFSELKRPFGYDVFLSFRGEDTRHGFTGFLYKALRDNGIHTFIDDETLQRGEEITPAIVRAIEESRIFITVLSIDFASSSFCLDELATILHCAKRKGLLVMPVFYKVDPSNLRHQKGRYGEAMAEHEERFKAKKELLEHNMEKLKKWKLALEEVANLSGFPFKSGAKYEYELIGEIVECVSSKISHGHYPVGLRSRVLEVRK